MRQGLIIIDVQNDYFEGGDMELENTYQTLKNILKVKKYFEQMNYPIFIIQHIKEKEGDFFRRNTVGSEIHKELLPIKENSYLIEKNFPNSFFKTSLVSQLIKERVEQLVIVGMMTHMCVDSTTRVAKELGYEPILLSDACTTKSLIFNSKIIPMEDVQCSFLNALSNFSKVCSTITFLKN